MSEGSLPERDGERLAVRSGDDSHPTDLPRPSAPYCILICRRTMADSVQPAILGTSASWAIVQRAPAEKVRCLQLRSSLYEQLARAIRGRPGFRLSAGVNTKNSGGLVYMVCALP